MRYVGVMQDPSLSAQIRDKARKIDLEIDRHVAAIKALESDRDELQVTLRTLKKMGLISEEPQSTIRIGGQQNGAKKTVPEMILEILARDFPEGAEPIAVLERVRERYDPDADPNNVRPTLWRMSKDGRVEKFGELYRLPVKKDGPQAEEASEPS